MMGSKTLAEIKRELQRAAQKDKEGIKDWLSQQGRTPKSDKSRNPKLLEEELLWISHLLEDAARGRRRRRATRGKSTGKKPSVVPSK